MFPLDNIIVSEKKIVIKLKLFSRKASDNLIKKYIEQFWLLRSRDTAARLGHQLPLPPLPLTALSKNQREHKEPKLIDRRLSPKD